MADSPSGAGGQVFATPLDAVHPHLSRLGWIREHITALASGTRRLLAVGAVDLRAHGSPFIEPDTLLAHGTTSLLAGRQAYRLGAGIGAEETFGALFLFVQTTGTSAPAVRTTAQQFFHTCALLI
jgi:hypothetical protein